MPANFVFDKSLPALRTEDDMKNDVAAGVSHVSSAPSELDFAFIRTHGLRHGLHSRAATRLS
jgi:hypothetical protein